MKFLAFLCISALCLFAGAINVENAYVKEVAPNMQNTAAFMIIKNSSDTNISLVSVSCDISKATEIHTHTIKDGMMAMQKVDSIVIVAKGEAILKPMNDHIMLIGLNKQLKAGQIVPIVLKFSNGESPTVNALVKNATR